MRVRPLEPTTRMTERRGFTLTEMAIVLGIIGAVLGGIWAAARKVELNQKANKAATEVMTVVSGLRALYAPKGYVDGAVLNQLAINKGIYPPEMLLPGGCTFPDNSTVTGSCPTDAFGTNMSIGGQGDYCWAGGCGATSINIVLWNVPAQNCPSFLATLVQNATTDGLAAVTSSGGGTMSVSASTQISETGITACSGNVVLEFGL